MMLVLGLCQIMEARRAASAAEKQIIVEGWGFSAERVFQRLPHQGRDAQDGLLAVSRMSPMHGELERRGI